MKQKYLVILWLLALIGTIDAAYLSLHHYQAAPVACSGGFSLIDCGLVLKSQYAVIFGIPLALLGLVFYVTVLSTVAFYYLSKKIIAEHILLLLSFFGFLFSLYLIYLQAFILKAFCLYCLLSALISTLLFITTQMFFTKGRKKLFIYITAFIYQNIIKPILFKIRPESVHNSAVNFGQLMGNFPIASEIVKYSFCSDHKVLSQKISKVRFDKPIGLSAGFDYEAKLTQVLPNLDFGFATVGTITNLECSGNPLPQLGRLPLSKSLMVNKGFKNLGACKTIDKLENKNFEIPIGISIGRTNTLDLKTQKQSVNDIISAFSLFESSKVDHSYYELNISCPNLVGNISFYPSKKLKELLSQVDKLKLTRPVFVKMPISQSNKETLQMLEVISKHSPVGVIIGNLQKDRNNPAFVKDEVVQFKKGNFSGKPTFDRSNELISLSYKHFHNRLTTIGCGGVFSALDAYEKIIRGASLVQLITGLVFQGPQLVADINFGLEQILKQNGFKTLSQAIGSKNN